MLTAAPAGTSGGTVSAPPRRWPWWLGMAALAVWAARGAEVSPGTLLGDTARGNATEFLTDFLRPDLSLEFLRSVGAAVVETLQISIAALLIALVIAAPLSLLAAENLSSAAGSVASGTVAGRVRLVPYALARLVLDALRAVPELIWALVFITAVGLGPFAGALAIGVHAGGLLGKLWAEQFEAVDAGPVESVRMLGYGRLGLVRHAVLPQARRHVVSLLLYQWECNVRAASIIGFVGAGGIGQQIDVSIRLFRYAETATLVLAVLLLVIGTDTAGRLVRSAAR